MLWLPPRKETAQSSVPANTGKRRQLKIPSFCAILKESIGRAVRPAYNNAAAVRPQEDEAGIGFADSLEELLAQFFSRIKMRPFDRRKEERESALPFPWKNRSAILH